MFCNESTRCGKTVIVRNHRSTHFNLVIRWRWMVRFALRLLKLQRRRSLYILHKRLGMFQKWYGSFGDELNPLNIWPRRFVIKYTKEQLIDFFFYVHVSVHRESMSIIVQQDATTNSFLYFSKLFYIFVVPCIMLNSEIIPTRCNNCNNCNCCI